MTGLLGWALPLVPFLAALAGFLVPRDSRRAGAALGISGAALAVVTTVALLLTGRLPYDRGTDWVDLGPVRVTLGLRLDAAALLVALAVTVVALAVQVYSVGYLAGDGRYGPYAAQISLFTAAMLLVVVSGDLILLLVGWEVMGACSYLLIAHDRRLPEAPAAAVKAFLVTRVGDVGFLLGILVLGVHAGSFRIADVLAPGALTPGVTTLACLLLLAGVAGKSAQFPLHTWLPDAMAGPTPISALIHAATMVAAGVYAVTRLYPLFSASPAALSVLAVMASVTMLLGAFAALAQDDIKRVLAWSTVSQLGYMTGALAVGAPAAALFHLLTHAAFKALLFLAAGSVIHAVGTASLARMGGLRRALPVTYGSMTLGLAALVGLPPLAGFWSKDEILHAAADGTGWAAVLVYVVGLLTVFITAWYAGRLWLRAFRGPARSDVAAHESPAVLTAPLLALAVPTALLGFAALVPGFARALGAPDGFGLTADALAPLAWALLGFASVGWVWRRQPALDPARVLRRLQPLSANAFYLDAVQRTLVVRPVRALASAARRADESLVDGAVEGTGRATVGLGGLVTRAHRAALPRAVTAVLGGVLLLGGVAGALVMGAWR